MENIYRDIATRTGGNIYIGVVGPVRTGKSTLIKRIMETLVIPNISDPYRKERAKDELPQSGSGKTIMTSEPKFIPEEAVEISPDGTAILRVRMIDSVGYMVDGAVGAEEDGHPRLVTTPWYDYEIPMTEAAELGTKKVMDEHCSIGIVVTTDGSITDISREDYLSAEKRAIEDMIATGKPFLVIVNSRQPSAEPAQTIVADLERAYQIPVLSADCQAMDTLQITEILQQLLYAFPMNALHIYLPQWVDALETDHPVKTALYETLLQDARNISNLGQVDSALENIRHLESIQSFSVDGIDLGSGTVTCTIVFPDALYYQILSSKAGIPIGDDRALLELLTELTQIKQEYEKISEALSAAKTTGYGIVMPTAEEMTLQPPQVVRKGSAFGVKLKAGAPSIHMIRVDIDTEISPMVGGEQQSHELISYLTGEDPEKIWDSNIFGRSVYTLIQEGLTSKLVRTPEDVRAKFRGSLTKIVNEGATGLICLIL